jgi:hypothetical protein
MEIKSKRTKPPKKEILRKELKSLVLATNKYLLEVVDNMSFYQLLCNCHPEHRPTYASMLYHLGLLTLLEAKEFAKIVMYRENAETD